MRVNIVGRTRGPHARLESTTAIVLRDAAACAIHGNAPPAAESHAPVITKVRLSIVWILLRVNQA